MGEQLIKPYQISIWEDKLIETDEESYYEEVKIATIGSDTMTSQARVYSPVFKINTNGEKTLTFSLKYKYYDEMVGDFVVNPFEKFLVNERKVKLFYKDEWHDFVIKEKNEESEEYTFSYTCTDVFVQELAKNGYGIVFDTELNNNQGTVTELAEKTLKDTDWIVDKENSDIIQQTVSEPIYICKVGDTNFVAYNMDTRENEAIEHDEEIYIFYNYIQNRTTADVQFIRAADRETWSYDNNNAIFGTNYRFLQPIEYDKNNNALIHYGDAKITVGALSTESQGYRLVYNTLTTFDPVTGETVDRYQITFNDGHKQDIYHYTTTRYGTTAILQNFVTSGTRFTVVNKNGINGWSNTVYTDADKLLHIGLATYPETTLTGLAELSDLKQLKTYLELEFPALQVEEPSTYPCSFYNSGVVDNANYIGGIAGGDKFILRYRYQWAPSRHGTLKNPQLGDVNRSGIRAVIAGYTNEEKTLGDGSKVLVKKIDEKKIYVDFTDGFYEGNARVTGGELVNNNYLINDIIQTPSDKYIYEVVTIENGKEVTHEYVWNLKENRYEERTANNFVNYYYTIGTAVKSIPQAKLADSSNRLGIFFYKADASNQYVYIEDIEITRYFKDANDNPILVGSAPTAKTEIIDNFYLKPKEGATLGSIEIYNSLESLAETYNFNLDSIKPLKNDLNEKILSIEASKSNCFNILQDLCETFECWMKIEVEHDSIGRIALDENHHPNKRIVFKKYVGKDNFAGFRYGINLTSINRTIDSNEFVTKLIVGQPVSDHTSKGILNIGEAKSNPSGESYILNFNYYLNQGLIKNREQFNKDLNEFNEALRIKNKQIKELTDEYVAASAALEHLRSARNVYVEASEVASDKYSKALSNFESVTGKSYSDFLMYGSH